MAWSRPIYDEGGPHKADRICPECGALILKTDPAYIRYSDGPEDDEVLCTVCVEEKEA